MRIQPAELGEHRTPIARRLSDADDAAAADADTRVLHVLKRVEAILVGSRGDDLRIELLGRVEIVIVCGEAGRLEALRLFERQHAERRAHFHPERGNILHHLEHRVERWAVRRIAPRRAHAEPRRSVVFRRARGRQHSLRIHQPRPRDAGVVMGALRAIRAIFRTAARLDAQQRAALYVRGVMMLAMNGLRAEEELGERKMIERLDALGRPIVTDV